MGVNQKGNKLGTELISNAIETAGNKNVKSVTASLAKTNKEVFDNAVQSGDNATDAFSKTPLGKSLNDLGFDSQQAQNKQPFPAIKAKVNEDDL